MAGFLDGIRGYLTGTAKPSSKAPPMSALGLPGFSAYGGYVTSPEQNWRVAGMQRYLLASDILANVSIVAASLRYMLNLISRPTWKAVPADDSDEAKAAAEFMESVLYGMNASWARIVRRSATYRYHGFGFHEWTAKKRDDGRIGIEAIDPRPQHTIQRWDLDDDGDVRGVWQFPPQTGRELYLPRQKLVYLVDDAFTDNPEGLGWFRQLVEPANRMMAYLRLEGIGFERDLAGIPVGRAPIAELNALVERGVISAKDRDGALADIRSFVEIKNKDTNTGLVLDSAPYVSTTETGQLNTSTPQWDIELLTGEQTSLDKLANAIRRTAFDMAAIIGTEQLLVGREGAGSLALSEDKSRNLYLNANSILDDMAEAYDRDITGPVWAMNGLDDAIRPYLEHEDVSFKDAAGIARTLADMAQAGAVLAPDDPAINDLRDLMGIEHAPELSADLMGALRGGMQPGGSAPLAPGQEPGKDQMPTEEDKQTGKAAPKTLYVQRKLLNADDLVRWAKQQGFASTVPAAEMHVTVAFSRAPVDWIAMGNPWGAKLEIEPGGPRVVEQLGDKGAVVLLFASDELTWRHDSMCERGCSWDYDSFQPHVTITYEGDPDLDLSKIEPYQGPLKFGPELFAEVVEDWEQGLTEQ